MTAGLDLAGSPEKPSGIAVFDDFKWKCCQAFSDEDIIQKLKDARVVAVDAPLSFPEQGGLRDCDLEIRKLAPTLPLTFEGMRKLTERGIKIKEKLEDVNLEVVETFPRAVEKLVPEGIDSLGFDSDAQTEHEKDASLSGFAAWCYKFDVHKNWKGIITPSKEVLEMMREQVKKSNKVKREKVGRADRVVIADLTYSNQHGMCGVLSDCEVMVEDFDMKMNYVPSLLAFRELDPIKNMVEDLKFDLLFVNGHGLAHPRGLGLASHLGVELDVPVIGVCKRLLTGVLEGDKIMMNGEQVGWKHRSRYLTIGHKVSLEDVKEYADLGVNLLKDIDKYLRAWRREHAG